MSDQEKQVMKRTEFADCLRNIAIPFLLVEHHHRYGIHFCYPYEWVSVERLTNVGSLSEIERDRVMVD